MSARPGFTLVELLIVIAIIGVLSAVVLVSLNISRTKAQDSARVSAIRQIQYALALYHAEHTEYPTCLYSGGLCTTTLEGTAHMPVVPVDPVTGIGYAYAAIGLGPDCSKGYHLGASLADKGHTALMSGSDAAPRTRCTGSANDFSGLSRAAVGQKCNTTVGVAQPTDSTLGETCYDVTE